MNRKFINAVGEYIEYDGVSPITWRISVYSLLTYQNQILLVKQKRTDKFQLPGGGIELLETQGEALSREIFEETGLHIDVSTNAPFYMYENFFFKRTTGTYHHSLMLFYKHELTQLPASLTPANAEEISEVCLVPFTELGEDDVQKEHWDAIKRVI
jgi:ADP-ribose pyrophosphatase YjhB (NUDIX family)